MSGAPIGPASGDLGQSVSEVLAQMRALQAQATSMPELGTLRELDQGTVSKPEPAGFQTLLKTALDGVNELQQASGALSSGFVRGEHNDLVAASIASQKSSLAFQAVVTARNRVVSAYQDIMNMPI